MSPMVRRSLTIEFALLGFLRQGALHGYQIHRQFSQPDGLGQVWRLKQAQLYAMLGRLEEDGYMISTLQQQETRPARRVYQLTGFGERAFIEWLSSPVQAPRQMRQEFQLKLYFAQFESQAIRTRLITVQRSACQRWLANHQYLATEEKGNQSYAWLVDQYRIGQIQAMLAWLDLCDSFLKSSENPMETQ